MSPIRFRAASAADEPALHRLLQAAALPDDDVATDRQSFTLAFDGERLVGSVALEIAGAHALVRSLAVAPSHRGQGLGAALDEQAIEAARRLGLDALYLLTTTARKYALRRGYQVVAREEVPPGVRALPQFTSLCPASATCLWRRVAPGRP